MEDIGFWPCNFIADQGWETLCLRQHICSGLPPYETPVMSVEKRSVLHHAWFLHCVSLVEHWVWSYLQLVSSSTARPNAFCLYHMHGEWQTVLKQASNVTLLVQNYCSTLQTRSRLVPRSLELTNEGCTCYKHLQGTRPALRKLPNIPSDSHLAFKEKYNIHVTLDDKVQRWAAVNHFTTSSHRSSPASIMSLAYGWV